MNRAAHSEQEDDLRAEYEFTGGLRGTHYQAYRRGTNVVFLDPDVARVLKDSASVIEP